MPRAGAKICHHSRQGQRKSVGKRTATCVVFVSAEIAVCSSFRAALPTHRPWPSASAAGLEGVHDDGPSYGYSRGYSRQSIRAGRGGAEAHRRPSAVQRLQPGPAVRWGRLSGLPPDCLRLGLVGLLPALALATRSARDRPPAVRHTSSQSSTWDGTWDSVPCWRARSAPTGRDEPPRLRRLAPPPALRD